MRWITFSAARATAVGASAREQSGGISLYEGALALDPVCRGADWLAIALVEPRASLDCPIPVPPTSHASNELIGRALAASPSLMGFAHHVKGQLLRAKNLEAMRPFPNTRWRSRKSRNLKTW